MSAPESADEFYDRVLAATDAEGRLPVAVEEMPGWDIYPYEIDSLRLKPLQPLSDEEPARSGEDPADCSSCRRAADPAREAELAWSNERWQLGLDTEAGLPVALVLRPREHCDLPTVPNHLVAEMGRLIVEISAGVEALPSVGRVQLAKYGDGGAHLHLFFLGRPARALQFRGSPLIDWAENLPPVTLEVHRANAEAVGGRLVEALGGSGPGWLL